MSDFVLMNVRVTREARDAWHAFAEAHDVKVSVLVEAMTPFLQGDTKYSAALSDYVALAQKIKADRYRRAKLDPGQGTGQGMGVKRE